MTGTLKARVAGSWQSILGSGQEAAATARYNSAWGVVGSAQVTTVFTTSATHTTGQATGLAVTVTETAGRRLNIRVQHNPYPSGGVQAMQFGLQRNGVTIDTWFVAGEAMAAGSSLPLSHTVAVTATGGSATYSVQVAAISVNTAVSDFGSASAPRTIVVEDAGPVTPASIAPPTAGPRVVASGNALGVVGVAAMILMSGAAIAGATLTPLSNPLSVNLAVGRRYRLHGGVRATSSAYGAPADFTTANSMYLRVTQSGGTTGLIAGNDVWYNSQGSYQSMVLSMLIDGTGATETFTLNINMSRAGTVWTDQQVGFFYVEDVGPNTSPALPIPVPSSPTWYDAAPEPGRWMAPAGANTTLATANGWAYFMPVRCAPCNFDGLGVEVTTAVGSSALRLAIYNNHLSRLEPATLLKEAAATVASDSTGVKTNTFALAPFTGGVAWLAVKAEGGGPTLRAGTGYGEPWVMFAPGQTPPSLTYGCWAANLGAGAFPTTLPASLGVAATGGPKITFRTG